MKGRKQEEVAEGSRKYKAEESRKWQKEAEVGNRRKARCGFYVTCP
jgi:hypothetical protein